MCGASPRAAASESPRRNLHSVTATVLEELLQAGTFEQTIRRPRYRTGTRANKMIHALGSPTQLEVTVLVTLVTNDNFHKRQTKETFEVIWRHCHRRHLFLPSELVLVRFGGQSPFPTSPPIPS